VPTSSEPALRARHGPARRADRRIVFAKLRLWLSLIVVASCKRQPSLGVGSHSPLRESLARVVVPGGPVLSAPLLSDTPAPFRTAFRGPDDDASGRLQLTTPCVFRMHGTLGTAPVHAVLTANGRSLRVEVSGILDARKTTYQGILSGSPCAHDIEDDAGVLGSESSSGELAGWPNELSVSLERSRVSLPFRWLAQAKLEGHSVARGATQALVLRSVPDWRVATYAALERQLVQYTGAVLDIEEALDTGQQSFIVAYWATDRQLWLAALAGEHSPVRSAVATGLFCDTERCTVGLAGAEPRSGFSLVIVNIKRWRCQPSCTRYDQAQLWTLTARGFVPSGPIQTAARADGFVDVGEEVATSLQWVSVDDRLPVDLLLQRQATSGWPAQTRVVETVVFVFDPHFGRYVRDQRVIEMSPAVRSTLQMCAEFDAL